MNPNQKHVLSSRQIKRRKHTPVQYYDNGWRCGYIIKLGRKWATGRKSACGSLLRLDLSTKGRDWKEIVL